MYPPRGITTSVTRVCSWALSMLPQPPTPHRLGSGSPQETSEWGVWGARGVCWMTSRGNSTSCLSVTSKVLFLQFALFSTISSEKRHEIQKLKQCEQFSRSMSANSPARDGFTLANYPRWRSILAQVYWGNEKPISLRNWDPSMLKQLPLIG